MLNEGGSSDQLNISTIQPNAGEPGSLVSIKGQGFLSESATEVFFDTVPGFVVSVAEDEVVARVPALNKSGFVDVAVHVNGSSTLFANGFRLTGESACGGLPIIQNVVPSAASSNESVAIKGAGFSTTTVVSIGSMFTDATFDSSGVVDALIASVPNLDAFCTTDCHFDVVVQNDNGCQFVLENGFTYIKDSDGDGLNDIEEVECANADNPNGTDPFDPDTDGDGLSDYVECALAADCNPFDPDTDGNTHFDDFEYDIFGTCTGNEDFDQDGFAAPADCDDENPQIYPGALMPNGQPDEVNGIDYDCTIDKPSCDPSSDLAGSSLARCPGAGILLVASGSSSGNNFLCINAEVETAVGEYWSDTGTYQIRTRRMKLFWPNEFLRKFSAELSDQISPAECAWFGSQSDYQEGCFDRLGNDPDDLDDHRWSPTYSIGESGPMATPSGLSECVYQDNLFDIKPEVIEVEADGLIHTLRARMNVYRTNIAVNHPHQCSLVFSGVIDRPERSCVFGD